MNWIAGWINPKGCEKRCRCWKSARNGVIIRVYRHPIFNLVFAQNSSKEPFILASADASVTRMKKLMENANV